MRKPRYVFVPVVLITLLTVLSSALVAQEAFVAKGKDKGGVVKAVGVITALTDTEITVGGVTFLITSSTKVIKGKLEDLALDMEVEVIGRRLSDGTVEAFLIKILAGKPDPKNKNITGIVTSLDTDADGNVSAVTVDGETTVDIEGPLAIAGRHGLPATTDNLVEGMRVRILYNPYFDNPESDSDGVLKNITVLDREAIKGKIEDSTSAAVSLPNLVVNTEIIYYDDITILIGAGNGVEDPGELAVGTSVQALCNAPDDGTFIANKIAVTNSSDGSKPFKESGIVSGVARGGGGIISFTLEGGQIFLVTAETEFKVKGYDGPLPHEDFIPGLEVLVKSFLDADGNNVAIWVRVILPIYKYCGEVEAVGPGFIKLLGLLITVTEYTEYEGFDTDLAAPADIAVGDWVEVKALLWPDGSLVAASIEPCDGDLSHVRGEIESVTPAGTGAVLVVAGVNVIVSTETEIYDGRQLVDVSALEVGKTVDVWGEFGLTGALAAERIKIR